MIDNTKKYLQKGSKTLSKTINIFSVESNISKELEKIQFLFKKDVEIGSYPFFRLGKIGVSIVSRSKSQSQLVKVEKKLKEMVKKKGIKVLRLN